MTEVSGLTADEARIDHAAKAIRGMTREMSEELRLPRSPVAEALSKLTAQAPLRSLAIAFLLGVGATAVNSRPGGQSRIERSNSLR